LRAILPDQGLRAARLRWAADDGDAAWRIEGLTSNATGGVVPRAIRLAVADGRTAEEAAAAGRLSIALELTTSEGASARIPLDRYGALPPPLPVRLVKHPLLEATLPFDLSLRPSSEVVLQTYEVPLSDAAAIDPTFRPERLASVAVVPAAGPAGDLWLAEVVLAD
jgi:hypothetical protein